jgi:DNA polymerase-3 subunit gamma/tau
MQEIVELGPQIGVHTLLAMLQIVEQAAWRLKQTTHGRTVVELALVRICCLDELDDLATALDRLNAGGSSPAATVRPAIAASAARPQPSLAAEAAALKKNVEVSHSPSRDGEAPAPPDLAPLATERGDGTAVRSGSAEAPFSQNAITFSSEQANALWRRAISEFHDLLGDHASMAHQITAPGGNRIVVGFPKKYALPKSFCERPEQSSRLEQALSAAAGGAVKIEFKLLDEQVSEVQQVAPRGPSPHERLREKSQLPFVRKALEMFDARPVRVEEGE